MYVVLTTSAVVAEWGPAQQKGITGKRQSMKYTGKQKFHIQSMFVLQCLQQTILQNEEHGEINNSLNFVFSFNAISSLISVYEWHEQNLWNKMDISFGFLKNQINNNGKAIAYTLSKDTAVSDEKEKYVPNEYTSFR